MAIYFRAADRREVSASEALDARGVLRHGYGQRVPYAMCDAAPRFAWDAHRDRDSLLVTDGRRIGGVEGCRPGFRIFTDDDTGRQAIANARAAYIFDLENAYRSIARPPFGAYPYSPSAEGTSCSVDGRPGRLVREGNVLVCKPVAELSKVSAFRPVGSDARTVCPDGDGDGEDDKKEEPKPMGRSKCPECEGRGVVHGRTCQACGGDGWVDDEERMRRQSMAGGSGSGELPDDYNDEQLASANSDSRRMLDVHAVSANHQRAMAKIYQRIAADVSQRWRER